MLLHFIEAITETHAAIHDHIASKLLNKVKISGPRDDVVVVSGPRDHAAKISGIREQFSALTDIGSDIGMASASASASAGTGY